MYLSISPLSSLSQIANCYGLGFIISWFCLCCVCCVWCVCCVYVECGILLSGALLMIKSAQAVMFGSVNKRAQIVSKPPHCLHILQDAPDASSSSSSSSSSTPSSSQSSSSSSASSPGVVIIGENPAANRGSAARPIQLGSHLNNPNYSKNPPQTSHLDLKKEHTSFYAVYIYICLYVSCLAYSLSLSFTLCIYI